jgi:hypothetical protein
MLAHFFDYMAPPPARARTRGQVQPLTGITICEAGVVDQSSKPGLHSVQFRQGGQISKGPPYGSRMLCSVQPEEAQDGDYDDDGADEPDQIFHWNSFLFELSN